MEFGGPRKKSKKKKRNTRFLANAKGYAKQGNFGRGTEIDANDFNYFITILDTIKGGFEDVEEKVIMANNMFEQTKECEIHFASNQVVCKALEALIGFVDAEHLERFLKAFADDLRPICSDSFASHVLEKMVGIAFLRGIGKLAQKDSDDALDEETGTMNSKTPNKRVKSDLLSEEDYNLETEFTQEHRSKCRTFVERVSKFLLNNLEDYVWDPCANHIMRTCILLLAGIHVTKVAFEKATTVVAKNRKLYEVPIEWIAIMKEYPERLQMWPQFADLPYSDQSSALLSTICVALNVIDKSMLKHFGKKILNEALLKPSNAAEAQPEDEEAAASAAHNLPSVFEHNTAVILLETLLTVAYPKLFTQLYAMLFKGRIMQIAQHRHFAVQKLLQHITDKEDFESVFSEFTNLEELLKMGHTGVIEALAHTCLRLGTKQAQMVVGLQTAVHTIGDKNKSKLFFQCLLKLKPYDIVCQDESGFVHLHGSMIAQHILHYNKPIFLVNCILETPADKLVEILNKPNGSHIADAFVQSKYIGEKSREKFIRHLDGFYIDLAVTKFGSRVIDCLYYAAQDSQKATIVKELANKSNMLTANPFGRILHSKFRINTYRLSATQWQASLHTHQPTKEQKTAELFKDIIT